ncbi:DUF397 domain-containing protein [Kitasatospora sp. NPDC093806]|uniref:DUF397 domain-containing protein n=1 Tax=Kitasatospora sp. NPDC093806 TaxID=3155075 RepID=UPI003442739D
MAGVFDPRWQKASCSGSSNACVEMRTVNGLVELRESDDPYVIVQAAPAAFAGLLGVIKVGGLDHVGATA